jgi:hypothetical protein
MTLNGDFSFVDVNGDGIWEIQVTNLTRIPTTDDESSPEYAEEVTTYYWDGSSFVSEGMPQPTKDTYYPRNRLDLKVTANCTRQGNDSIKFAYHVKNHVQSVQRVNALYFAGPPGGSASLSCSPTGWTDDVNDGLIGFYKQSSRMFGASPVDDYLVPGDSGVFSITDKWLPTISTFYARGYNLNTAEFSHSPLDNLRDILSNSFVGQTIGPAALPPTDPTVSASLTDTLITFVSRCRTLNWITDQSTTDKYTAFFTRVRADLNQQQSDLALSRLDTVLTSVVADSGAHLTSEAYALIRFNTEYLKALLMK